MPSILRSSSTQTQLVLCDRITFDQNKACWVLSLRVWLSRFCLSFKDQPLLLASVTSSPLQTQSLFASSNISRIWITNFSGNPCIVCFWSAEKTGRCGMNIWKLFHSDTLKSQFYVIVLESEAEKPLTCLQRFSLLFFWTHIGLLRKQAYAVVWISQFGL